jgi:hypothetical protein
MGSNALWKSGTHLKRFFAFNGYAPGLGSVRLSNVFSFGVNHRNRSRVTGFGVPGSDGCRKSDRRVIGFFPVWMLQDDVTSGKSVHVKPEIVGCSDTQGEYIVIGIRFPRKGLEAVGKLVFPKIGLRFSAFHNADLLPARSLEYTANLAA